MLFEPLIHSLIRLYCSKVPIEFGKGRLQKIGRRLLYGHPITVPSKHNISLELTFPEDAGWEMLFYRGTFETGTTDAFHKLLRADDVVFDIGANLGWYTILSSQVASKGECHAFEPVPFIYNKLQRNCQINHLQNKIHFQNLALGDKDNNEVVLYTFKGLYHGHSSLSTLDRADYVESRVPMVSIDTYISRNQITRLDLIKMDTEGAELKVLQGADQLLSRDIPPIWIIELNTETSASFGHTPTDVLDYIASKNDYQFYRIVRGWGATKLMNSTSDYQNGDNAICIPTAREYINL